MADFELIPAPIMSPTQCVLCHGSGPVVDTKVQIPGTQYGRVYVCVICAGQLARAVAWVDPVVHARLREAHEHALETVGELERSLEAVQERWADLLVPGEPDGDLQEAESAA